MSSEISWVIRSRSTAGQRAVAGGEHVGEDGAHLGLELGGLEVGVVQLRTELLEQLGVHALLEVLEPVLGGFGARDAVDGPEAPSHVPLEPDRRLAGA